MRTPLQTRLQPGEGDERGAAVAEFAISLLVLCTAAVYSMYVGEAFVLGAKAQEAEITAGWDISAYRLHDFTSGSYRGLYSGAASRSASRVKTDLTDFDSFTGSGGNGRTLPISVQKLTSVTCELRSAEGRRPAFTGTTGGTLLHSDGYVGCQAKVSFENQFIAKRSFDEFYQGKPDQITSAMERFSMCGIGSNVNGCTGGSGKAGFVLLTDDWGLEDGRQNPIGTQSNRKFYNPGKKIYVGGPGSGAVSLAMGVLLGAGDMGQTSTYKLGYLSAISRNQNIASDRGPRTAHMSPWDEEATPDTFNVASASQRAYGDRNNDHYLAKRQANYNSP